MSHPGDSKWFLLETGYAPKTTKDYKKAVLQFLDWCDERDLAPSDFDELDDSLCEWIHELYADGDGEHDKQKAKNALFGIQMLLPRTKGKLVISTRSLDRWSRARPSVAYPPLTWSLAVTLAVQMIRSGHYRFAVATVLGFDCLLRVSEILALRKSDVVLECDVRMGAEYRQMSIRIRKAKTGVEQSVDVRNQAVKKLLRTLVRAGGAKEDPLFPGGVNKFRRVFKACCADLALSPLYVPHSLRHGGATRMYLAGESIERILVRGRWAATKSARRYIQSTKAIAIATSVPIRIQALASVLVSDVVSSFARAAQSHIRGVPSR